MGALEHSIEIYRYGLRPSHALQRTGATRCDFMRRKFFNVIGFAGSVRASRSVWWILSPLFFISSQVGYRFDSGLWRICDGFVLVPWHPQHVSTALWLK
jgi:hypothetical protein